MPRVELGALEFKSMMLTATPHGIEDGGCSGDYDGRELFRWM